MQHLPVVVIGAGPIGLAALAHLHQRGQAALVLEAGSHAAVAVRQWGHVRMFSSWAMNVDACAAALLQRHGWRAPAAASFPTGQELVDEYVQPLAHLPELSAHIRFGQRVRAVTRFGLDKRQAKGRDQVPFELHIESAQGDITRLLARAVIDASGTWGQPNPGGHSGLPAVGECGHAQVSYAMPPLQQAALAARFVGRDTLVLGGGQSALQALLDLVALRGPRPGHIVWVTRGPTPRVQSRAGGLDSLLPERASALVQVHALLAQGVISAHSDFALEEVGHLGRSARLMLRGLRQGRHSVLEADELVVCTGFRPDLGLLSELQVALDPWLESSLGVGQLIRQASDQGQAIPPPYGVQALLHPEPNLFIAGMKSHGRAPNFFLFYGYEQVRSIAAHLAGDHAAAARVELQMPAGAACGGCGDGACCGSVGGADAGACGTGCGAGGCCA